MVTGEFPHKGPVTRQMIPFDDVITSTILPGPVSQRDFHVKTYVYQYEVSYLASDGPTAQSQANQRPR